MTVDRRPLWHPFSESATDQPSRAQNATLPRPGRSPFQEPTGTDPAAAAVPAQRPAAAPVPLGGGGPVFTAAG